MSDTGRLTVLLEQYRDRLHNRGEESHDDEILYILQVLESPLMREFLTDNIPGGGAALLQQVASAFEDQESDVHLSPQSKRKRQLARQASLRALKIALTPRSSPSNSPKVSKASENRLQGVEYPLTQNITANRYRKRGGSHKSSPSPTGSRDVNDKPHPVNYQIQPKTSLEISKSPDQVVPQDTPYNLNHIYISPYTGKPESLVAIATSTSPTDTDEYDSSHQHVLSNSTDTLIERTVTPVDNRVKKYSTGSDGYSDFVKKGLNSEDIRTPEMGESQEDNFMQMLDFNEPSIAPSLVPVNHRNDQPHPRKDQTHPLPPLPSYTEALSSQQRVKSFEDLLNSKPNQSIHIGPSVRQPQTQQQSPTALPPYYSFRGVCTGGVTQSQNPPISQNGTSNPPLGGRFLTLSLFKGPQGLGFSINKKKNTKKGELSVYVQDVQVGSVADTEGIRKGDYLVSINKQKVSGIGVSTIVSLLQQVKGKVEIVLFRKDGGVVHEGSPSPVFLPPAMPHPPTQIKQLNSPKLNKAPHSFPILPQLNHRITPSPPPGIPSTGLVLPPSGPAPPPSGPAPPPSGPAPPPSVSIPPPPKFVSSSSLNNKSSPPDSPVALPTLFSTKITSSPASINSVTPPPPISMTQPPHVPTMTMPSSITTSQPSHLLMGQVISNSSSYAATPPPPSQVRQKPRPSSSNITELVSVNLINQGRTSGFGFSLVTEPNSGNTFIKSIVPNGLAHKDGRLCPNDRIVVVNGQSIEGLSHEAVSSILKEINRQGQNLAIVVARVKQDAHNSDNEEDLVSDTDSSSDYEDHEIELVKPVGQGLGIGINALVNDEKGVDRGIYIKSVNPNGPAGLCGNVFIKDRIIKVNEYSLKSLSNMEAANHLRSSGQVVKLVLRRHKPVRRPFKVTVVKREQQQSSEESPSPTVTGPSHFKYNQTGQDEGDDDGDGVESIRGPVPLRGNAPMPLNFGDYEVEDDEIIEQRWKGRIPHDRVIMISRISRAHSNTSLGFTMESVFVRDDIGQSHDGGVCHVIQSILPGGLIDQDSILMVDDELLEVNGIPLVGMTHDQATHLVQSIAGDVTIVVCRPREDGLDEIPPNLIDGEYGEEVSLNATNPLTTTSESEDDHHSNSETLTSSSSPALHSIYLTSAIPDFSSRFERQSWRKRQAELTKKLKERFETKRWQYYRNLQERIEELEKVDHELEARTQRRKENEEKQEPEGNEKDKGMPLHSTAFDYSYPSSMSYYSGPIEEHVDVVEEPLTNKRDSVASEDSSAGVLSPVPGSGLWDSDVIEVELQRENDGLGFSILDFADPINQGDRVILVHSLVPGGTAEKDGRIQRGDKLSSVNGVSVVNHTLEFTVEQLKSTSEDGLVHICINHPIPDTPDINSTPSSFSRDSIAEEEGEEDNEQEDDEQEEEGEDVERHPMGAVNDGEDDIVSVTDNEEKTVRSKQQQEMKTTETGTNDQIQSNHHGNERHHSNNWQGKQRSFNEEEPPPPYTEVDPLEARKQNGAVRRISSQDNNGRSLTPGMLPGGGTGPTQPHPMFNRTRSDEPAMTRGHYGHLNDFHGTVRMMESTSEETLVASVSNQDLHVASGSQPSPKQHSSPHMSGRNFITNSNTLTSQDSNQGLSQVPTASPRSQDDSAQERVSPDTSDTGDHSAETEAEPRSVEIVKGPNPLGMSLMEDKGLVYVKKIESTSALGRDGRIRAGDRILSINGKSLEGMAFSKVKSILKRASSNRSTRIKIKYIPASLPPSNSVGMGEHSNQTDHPHYAQSHAVPSHQPYPMRQVIPHHPMATPLQTPLNPGLIPPSAQATNYPHWVQQGQHMGYNPTGPSMPTRPQVNLHTSYIEHPVPIKPPPPPYQLYQGTVGHQPFNAHMNYIPGMEYQTPAGPGGWNVGLQNPIQYGGRGEFMGNSQYQSSMTTAANQQMSAPPTHLMTHPPHQPPYQQQHESYRYMQYKQEEVGGAGMRSGNGNYDMKQNRNVASEWQQQGNQQIDNYSSRKNPGSNGNHLEPVGPPRVIEVKRDKVGSLGISLGLPEGGREGVVIIDLSHACSAINKGKLLVGDRILEVNGHNLRHATQSEAVNIIKHSTGPVKMLVQSYTGSGTGGGANGRRRPQYSPLHSNDGSWAIDEEEDESLRQLFPNACGYLFEVTLNKGNGALGLSIWKTRETQSVVVMQVQPGGLADQTARIRRGDEILQVNDRYVLGWRHEDVSRLLKQSPPLVKMILVRPLPFPVNSTQSNLPTSTAGVQNLRQKLHVLQEKQQQQQQYQIQQGEEPTPDDNNTSTTVTKQPAASKPVAPEKEVEEDNGNSINALLVNSGLPLVKAISIDRDDDIGLGFTVSEIESQGEPRVVVNSIVPNGPADKEGQLNVGDNIISIDGHKVIGAKYEKATHLLQQARSRGTVDLIVSSQTKLPVKLTEKIEPTPHKRKNMGEKRKRVRSEGVTLRNKITKKPQIRSKRRPVSVDCEINYDLSGILRIDSQSSGKGEGSSSGSHSNRNSRVLNEADVRQGGANLVSTTIDQNEIKPGKLSTIKIFRGEDPLGVSITGGVGSHQEGVFINKIHPGTPAAFDGRLKPGDRIIKVGLTPVDTATKDDVIKMIIETQSVVQFTVYRVPTLTPDTPSGAAGTGTPSVPPPTAINSTDHIETVEVIKPEQRGIGLMIVEDNTNGVIVSDVVDGEAAAFTARIHKGDKILAINGEDITTAGRDVAISLLSNCRGKVFLKVQHLGEDALRRAVSLDNTLEDYSPSHYQRNNTSPSKGVPRKLPNYHSPSPPTNGALPRLQEYPHQPPPTDQPTPLRDSRGTTPLRSDHSYDDDAPSLVMPHQQYRSTNRFRDVVGQNIPDSAHIPQGHEVNQLQRRNARVVHLRRGPTGLGFSIVGGKGSSNGDLPICVRTVSRESAAGKEAMLQPGDVIIAVNGVSFDNCTHQTAVETLKRCGDSIMLTICSP